jgi:predicted short-subunit dehydrogenase-like oxidoreductase (DUF2520 family)
LRVCILGRGKLGTALARGIADAGGAVSARSARAIARPEQAELYLLCVPDAALTGLAARLGPQLPRGASALHCAGARSHEELSSLRSHGVSIGALHPVVSFASRRHPPTLQGTTFVGQGDPRAVRRARRLARLLGAHFVQAEVLGPAYHSSAALVANAGVALAHAGVDILERLGIPRAQAIRACAGLLGSVSENLQRLGTTNALTGPVARGDDGTLRAHLTALRQLDPALASAYLAVQPLVLACARDAGLDVESVARLEREVRRATRAQRKT